MKKLLFMFVLINSTGCTLANTINIQMLAEKKQIHELLEVQKQMTLSENPKQLSNSPQAICFNVNINEYLFIGNDVYNSKPIYGCIFSDQIAMNAALLRAGLYVHTSLGMATDKQLFTSTLMNTVGGHDFDGAELSKYHQQAVIADKTEPKYKQLKEIEKTFYKIITAPISQRNKENYIFFAIINTKKYKENLSHELLHAQYYNMPQMKPILLTEWEKIPPTDQQVIINSLRDGGYNIEQQQLLLRELYSYFLQYNAKDYLAGIKVLSPMSKLVDLYAFKIKAALENVGITVISL